MNRLRSQDEIVLPRWCFRLATDLEKLSWSFGRVTTKGTCCGGLADPRIFGHTEDYRCVCGKVVGGPEVSGRICSECGVRVGQAMIERSTRCGHIELFLPVCHPWQSEHRFQIVPVSPVGLRSDLLSERYFRILESDARIRNVAKGSGAQWFETLVNPSIEVAGPVKTIQAQVNALIDGDPESGYDDCLARLFEKHLRGLGSAIDIFARGIGLVVNVSVRV